VTWWLTRNSTLAQ